MKIVKIITHPAILVISFMLIMISGEHWGGFYLLYLLLALPHGGIHALLALAGIGLLGFSYSRYGRSKKFKVEPVLNIAGACFLVASLYLFFHNDRSGYNNGTFEQLVPLITLVLFALLITGFVIYNMVPLRGNKKVNGNLSLKKA